MEPDEQARSVTQLVFEKFDEFGSFGKVYRYLTRNQIWLGMRLQRGPRRGELEWRPLTRAMLGRMLHHPIYAGAYSYGRRRVDRKRTAANAGKVRMQAVPMSEWKVLQRDRFKCVLCGDNPAHNAKCVLHVDHIVPWSKGGKTRDDNLRTLCAECNVGRSNRFCD